MPLASLLDEQGFWSAEGHERLLRPGCRLLPDSCSYRYGLDAYKELSTGFRDGLGTLETALQQDIWPGNPRRWRSSGATGFGRLDVPTIEPGIDERAAEIFRMEDPSNDDTGDGDYLYPNGPAIPGRRARPDRIPCALERSRRLCFELTYREPCRMSRIAPDGDSEAPSRGSPSTVAAPGEEWPFSFEWSSNATLEGQLRHYDRHWRLRRRGRRGRPNRRIFTASPRRRATR